MAIMTTTPSTEQAQAQERNQCDGCARGAPLRGWFHVDDHGYAFMVCQKDRYLSSPRAEETPAA
jgi:hypothetical protein